MRIKIISYILCCCLFISSVPAIAQNNSGETEIHGSSVELSFSARSRDRYIGHLTLFAAALVSMYQVKRCISPAISCGWSTWTSAIGGVALLAGEIVNIATHKNVLRDLDYNRAQLNENRERCLTGSAGEEKVNQDEDKKVCSQFGAIIAQRDAYESIRNGLMVQLTLRTAAGVAYLASSGLEVIAHTRKTASDSAMIGSAASAQASCVAFAAGPQAAACGESVARCEVALGSFQTYMTGKIAQFNDPSPTPSLASCTSLRTQHQVALRAVQLGCVGCCSGNVAPLLAQLEVETQLLQCMANFAACDLGCQPELVIVNNQKYHVPVFPSHPSELRWITMLLEQSLPSAKANSEASVNSILQQIGSALSLSGFGALTLTGLITSQKYAGDNFFSTPVKRAVWYGVIGAIVSLSTLHTNEALSEVNGYISDLNGLLQAGDLELDSYNPTPSNTLAGGQHNVDEGFEDFADIQYPEYEQLSKGLCPNGGDGKGKCLAVPDQVFSDLRELNLNDVAGVVSNLEDMGNKLVSNKKGSVKDALKIAKKVLGKKSLVKKFNKEARSILKQTQEEAGLEAQDIDKMIQKAAKYAMANTRDYLKDNKVDLNKMFEGGIEEAEEEENRPTAKPKTVIKISEDLAEEIKPSTIRFNLSGSTKDEVETNGEEGADQDYSHVKALHKSEESIFEVITERYIKTGFSKLLDEI